MTQGSWRLFLEVAFVPFTGASAANPQLLIVDGHASRKDPGTLALAPSQGVEVFLTLPHTTHILCPLDTPLFSPLKKKWHALRLTQWNYRSHSECATLYGELYLSSFTGAKGPNLAAGFRDDGLVPPDWGLVEGKCSRWFLQQVQEEAVAEEEAPQQATQPPRKRLRSRRVQTGARELNGLKRSGACAGISTFGKKAGGLPVTFA